MTSTNALHLSLLRPPILHILRAAGFTTTKPAVLDILTDLASRHLHFLATRTASHAQSHPHSAAQNITITDVRLALQDAGLLHPTISEVEQDITGQEDLRGVSAFVNWCTGPANAEIRRIAGLPSGMSSARPTTTITATGKIDNGANSNQPPTTAEMDPGLLLDLPPREDFLTQLKKKHSKTGEESRYQGTVLGKDMDEREVKIEGMSDSNGGEEVDSIQAWERRLREKLYGMMPAQKDEGKEGKGNSKDEREGEGNESSGSSLTDISGASPAT
ncbi:MAG: hypothetical protein Q9217_003294 [Psora testacea]